MRSGFTIFALLLAGTAASAQLPSAGGQLLQIPPAPAPRQSIPETRVERPGTVASPFDAGPGVPVAALRITGQTVFTEGELLAVTGFKSGSTLNLGDLRAMAAAITDFYNRRGYFVARAYLTAQALTDGAVTIAVVEGRYDKVSLRNTSRLSNSVANHILAGLDSGDIVAKARLERRLLLLADVPGVAVKSTLIPGGAVGTSDLIVDVLPGRRITGSIEANG